MDGWMDGKTKCLRLGKVVLDWQVVLDFLQKGNPNFQTAHVHGPQDSLEAFLSQPSQSVQDTAALLPIQRFDEGRFQPRQTQHDTKEQDTCDWLPESQPALDVEMGGTIKHPFE